MADQLADFGVVPSAVTIRIAQLAAGYGRGSARTVTL